MENVGGRETADAQAATGVSSASPHSSGKARLLGVRRSSLPNSGARCDGSFGLFCGSQNSVRP